jgi:membrane-bound inhibitor of C-type lysozyme
MNRKLTAISGVILCAGLAACTTPKDTQELSQKTVEYRCGPGGEQPLSVQYTFQGTEPLAAKVIYRNQAVDLTRATTSNADMVGNTFRGNGYTWTTDKFTFDTVGTVKGNMLTQDSQQAVGGQTTAVSNIIVKDCQAVSAT